MASRTIISDSGGTERVVKRWGIVDSGGTTRMAKRVFIVDSGGTARQIFSSGILVTSGVSGTSSGRVGYQFGGYGSMSPTTATDGKTVIGLHEEGAVLYLTVSGFAEDPGASGWAATLTVNGVFQYFMNSPDNYAYDEGSGQAQWLWFGTAGLANGFAFTAVVA